MNRPFLLLFLLIGLFATAQAQPTPLLLAPSEIDAGDRYGYSVAADGEFAVVGAPVIAQNYDGTADTAPGTAFVYRRSGDTWDLVQRLSASDGQPEDRFGFSVALSGNRMVVGAPGNYSYGDVPEDGLPLGSAYVFSWDGTEWTEEQKLTPRENDIYDRFGHSVALDGDRMVVGAPGWDSDRGVNPFEVGALFVFERTGNDWSETQRLEVDDISQQAYLGWAVALEGDRIVGGAPRERGGGQAFVFRRGSSGAWSREATLQAGVRAQYHFYGMAVAIEGGRIAVGDGYYYPPTSGSSDEYGAVYVYEQEGAAWALDEMLLDPSGLPNSVFGQSLSLSDGRLLISATSQDAGLYYGAAHVYGRGEGGWESQAELVLPHSTTNTYYPANPFVALDGETVLLGDWSVDALSGEGYIFSVTNPNPTEPPATPLFRVSLLVPNPSRGGSALTYELEGTSDVWIAVYDRLGRTVAVLQDGPRPTGEYEVAWDEPAAPGTYLVRIQATDSASGETRTVTRLATRLR